MAPTNQPQDTASKLIELERLIKQVRDRVGLVSAFVGQGGLTIGDNGAWRMVDDEGVEILYFGPDDQGRQVIRVKRDGGSSVLYTAFTSNGNQYWRMTDRFDRELFSDDATTGGMARPWLPVQMFAKFSMAASSVYSYMNLPVASIASETVLWEGLIPLVSHPYISVAGLWGTASGTNSTVYKVKAGGTEIGTFTSAALENSIKGPFNNAAWLGFSGVSLTITAQATGSGNAACQLLHAVQRQTP